MTSIEHPFWVWIFFFAVVLIALFVDIGIVNRKAHAPTRKETFVWSIVWVSLALLFNGFIYWQVGTHHQDWNLAFSKAKEFLTGYLIELSLSVDNLFVFLLIFSFFKVPKKYQHRVLFWGIYGRARDAHGHDLRGRGAGRALSLDPLSFRRVSDLYGIKNVSRTRTNISSRKKARSSNSRRTMSASQNITTRKFFVIKDGMRTGTLLLLVLIVINVADLVFAVDSIPAIFGITTDRFIVYTSNIFAILGLRTFFFLLADLADRFHFLKYRPGVCPNLYRGKNALATFGRRLDNGNGRRQRFGFRRFSGKISESRIRTDGYQYFARQSSSARLRFRLSYR